ncbi:hypothetical protein IOD16_19990 [Saccharothrix sp. 6-C]|uniref:hypothetical protein n=1 Tax=Saccharothrix sp. 6-C TaxID=2781735 RepID=UPI001917503F|nr:hypothetical protein [Saccharothrix sp. 6-C]QQQ73571.1 hypothetical protein IOD16_19990 [Saccharothrix sp. 6-C]
MRLDQRAARLLLSVVIAAGVLGGGVATAAPAADPTGGEGLRAAVAGYQAAPGSPTTTVTSTEVSGATVTAEVATPPVTRSEIITRARTWTTAGVPYSQSDYYGGYRTDCSGFVSMAWKLSESLTTRNLDQVAHRIDKDDLKAGDILLSYDNHVVIFEKWADTARTEYYEFEQTPPRAVYRKIPYPYYSGTYLPYRYDNVIEDDGEVTALPGLSTISRSAGDLDVFAATSDGHLKHRNMNDGVWGCWATLPYNAKIKGDPAAIFSAGRIDVFAQGVDNRLKKITWTSAYGWYQWADMGDYVVTSSPAVTSRSATGIDVFAKNAANKIVYRHYDTVQGWTTSWSNIGLNASTVTASGAPAAVANADGSRMNVFARATDGSLLSLMWTRDAGWYSWADRGGDFIGRPAASTRGGDSVDIFVRDHDNSFVHRYSPNGADWTTYPASDFGGYILTSPTAVSMTGQRIDVFTRNSGADLIRKTWTGTNGWYEWAGHGAVGAPAC